MLRIERPVRSIVRAVAGAARRWSDADFPPRMRVADAICSRTGYSLPVVEYALDRLFLSITTPALEAAIASELGSVEALDAFVERAGRPRARALPIGRVCVISSRTTIGVAIVPAIFALCAKCDVEVKDRQDALVAAFFETLVQESQEVLPSAIARSWDGERDARDLGAFDAVVAFGDDATLERIRATLPIATRMIAFGSKASAGYVTREALADEMGARRIAEGAARDLLLYDTEGCLSLHALFVERGGTIDPARFAELLARAAQRAAMEFPQGPRTPQTAALVAAARDLASFRASAGTGAAYSDATASYVIALDPPADEPPGFLPRTLGVHAIDAPDQAAEYLARHRIAIEALCVAGAREDATALAIRIGAGRIAAFGALQAPPLGAYHGGRPRIADFVRWIGDET